MHFYEKFKIEVLGTSQGRHLMEIFLGRFADAHRTVLQYCKNIQQATSQYFTTHLVM